jgi:hypothetical protein
VLSAIWNIAAIVARLSLPRSQVSSTRARRSPE